MAFGGAFTCDLLDGPPETGVYKTVDGGRLDAFIRLGELVLIDDVDGDNQISITDQGELLPPDLLLARSNDRLLMFVERPAPADRRQFLTDWDKATPGYHLVAVPRTPLPTTGHTIDNDSTVVFDGVP
jgi:hypothetical protein